MPTSSEPRAGEGPEVDVFEMPFFETEELATVVQAFSSLTPCALGQAWLEQPEADLAAGLVRVGWRGDSVLILAELADRDIFTRAGAPGSSSDNPQPPTLGQRLWELGDVFEIFLRPVCQEAYVELQVAPNNQRLQLGYEEAGMVGRLRRLGSIESALIPGYAFESITWVRAEAQRWWVLARVPMPTVCTVPRRLPGMEWRFSFSRYDYTRHREHPVISSTSPHPVADFHRQRDWGVLRFREGPCSGGRVERRAA